MDTANQIVLYILILAKSLEPAVWLEEAEHGAYDSE